MTTTVLNKKISEVENKIQSGLVPETVLNTKISEVENKIPDYAKDITTKEEVNAEILAAKLTQINLVSKADLDNKLTNFNKRITWKETKELGDQKKINSLIKSITFFS